MELALEGQRHGESAMAVHVEIVVAGPPISNQQSTATGRANLAAWRARIVGLATQNWANPPLAANLKAIIINFYAGNRPSVDVDNMSKPSLDAMEGAVYNNDRQIVQAEITHVQIGAAFAIVGVRPMIVTSLQTGNQFVYVRIEDEVNPFPLPK
jgi:Holliday junction resolvase RusA-like endonuclease